MRLTLTSARSEYGTISARNSKMPGSTFAIDPTRCHVGAKLAQVEGSTCHSCYAVRLFHYRQSVRMGWTANFDKAMAQIEANPDAWAEAMAMQINHLADKTGERYHRWFDAGDLQSVDMLAAIVSVCQKTHTVRHWLPTREAKIVADYRKAHGDFPPNLVVRISSTMVGDRPINGHDATSTVYRAAKSSAATAAKGGEVYGHGCPAHTQGNSCGQCRACWDKTVSNVSYPLH